MTRPHLSIARHLIFPEILTTILIACSPPPFWLFTSLFILVYISFSGFISTSGQAFHDYFIGTTIMTQLLGAVAHICLTDPFRHIRHENETVPTKELPLLQKLYWAVSLKYNPRGIGWNYQVDCCHH
jgi:hypothetical protein